MSMKDMKEIKSILKSTASWLARLSDATSSSI